DAGVPGADILDATREPFCRSNRKRDACDAAGRDANRQVRHDVRRAPLLSRPAALLDLPARFYPQQIARIEQERAAQPEQEIAPAYRGAAEAAEMQREKSGDSGEPAVLTSRKIVGRDDLTRVGIQVRESVSGRAMAITGIAADDANPADAVTHRILERADLEGRRLLADASYQLRRAQGRRARRRRHLLRLVQRKHRAELVVVVDVVLNVVE